MMNFETLAKMFMKLVDERYPSGERIIQVLNSFMGTQESPSIEDVHKKIIVLGLMRDGIKEVAPQHVYRSLQHRDDLYHAIIEASEELEDQLQELEEKAASEETAKTSQQKEVK